MMGVQCLVDECEHYSDRDKCKYFRIPMNEVNYNSWKYLLNLTETLIKSKKNPRVCSCHFKEHKKPMYLDVSLLQPRSKRRTLLCNVDESQMTHDCASCDRDEADIVSRVVENQTLNNFGQYKVEEAVKIGNVDYQITYYVTEEEYKALKL